eukprot:2681367-Alexandrium_andersonii.AAC.1
MSASLVGSEMCIRDRDSLGIQAQPCRWHAGSLFQVLRPNKARKDWGRFCLLYTSDRCRRYA